MTSRKNLSNALFVVAQPLILNGVSIFSTAYIIRSLGPHAFGQWAIATSIVAVVTVLTNLGLRQQFIRSVAQNPDSAQEDLALQLGLRGSLSLLAGLIAVGVSILLRYPATVTMCTAVSAASLVIATTATTLGDLVQGMHRMKTFAMVGLASGILLTAASVVSVWMGAGPVELAMAYAVGPLLSLVLYGIIIRRLYFPVRITFSFGRSRDLLVRARSLAAYSLVSAVSDRAEQLILPKLAGITAFGYFSAGSMPASRLMIVPDGLTTAFYPSLSKSAAEGEEKVVRQVVQLAIVSLAVCFPIALLIMYIGPLLADILFPKNPGTFLGVLNITVWSLPLLGMSYPIGCALQAAGHDSAMAKAGIKALACNLVSASTLVFLFGLDGACWAWVARPAILILFEGPIFLQVFPAAVRRIPFARLALSAFLMTGLLYGLAHFVSSSLLTLVLAPCVAVAGYVTALAALRVFGANPLSLLRRS